MKYRENFPDKGENYKKKGKKNFHAEMKFEIQKTFRTSIKLFQLS